MNRLAGGRDGDYLRMRRRIGQRFNKIVAPADDLIPLDDDGTNWDLVLGQRLLCFAQRGLHPAPVGSQQRREAHHRLRRWNSATSRKTTAKITRMAST